jgi:hypothetical protein
VCQGVGVPDADLAGYEDRWIQYDHWRPKGVIGDSQADLLENMRPIHAKTDAPHPLDPKWADSTTRNCHRGKSNKYTGEQWVDYVRIFRRALTTAYADDLMADRDPDSDAYDVQISWSADSRSARFRENEYPAMIQRVNGEVWRSFSTVVPPRLLWRDDQVQSRSASHDRLAAFAWHLKTNPLLSPVLCRWAGDRLKVFDGNHRLSAFILAQPDHDIPVTIFDGPDPKRFLSVAAEAHDRLTQLKYQYTDKALKFSALHEDELLRAQERYGEDASEELAWRGLRPTDVRVRIAGRLTARLDEEGGWRMKWRAAGLTDPSWNQFLATYARLDPESAPFASSAYLREEEFGNLVSMCRLFDEELFDQLPAAKASLKTKWWKRAHARFSRAFAQTVKVSLALANTPERLAYAPAWTANVLTELRNGVRNWRESPAWLEDTAANNEADIDRLLTERGFTEAALTKS